jgi:hypothetical protein
MAWKSCQSAWHGGGVTYLGRVKQEDQEFEANLGYKAIMTWGDNYREKNYRETIWQFVEVSILSEPGTV